MEASEDRALIWCPECGRYALWKHKKNPTLRARIANCIVAGLDRATRIVESWRDQGE